MDIKIVKSTNTGVSLNEKAVEFISNQEKEPDLRVLMQKLAPIVIAVKGLVKQPLIEEEFIALLSLVAGIGIPEFSNSRLLHLLNENDFDLAAEEFLTYDKDADGKLNEQLVERRKNEYDMFWGFFN